MRKHVHTVNIAKLAVQILPPFLIVAVVQIVDHGFDVPVVLGVCIKNGLHALFVISEVLLVSLLFKPEDEFVEGD